MTSIHSNAGCRPARSPGRAAREPDWREDLPKLWLAQVVRPLFFSRQREYEIEAERVLGFEAENEPCYCRYEAVLTSLFCDDDDCWHVMPVYGEQLAGWRLIDDRWLIHRRIFHGEDCQAAQSFFSFADEMPR